MNQTKLYIIGNGFDMHHGIESSFSDFRDHVGYELRDIVDSFLSIGDDWADLERALGQLNVEELIDFASRFLVSYGAEEWSDAYHHDYGYEIDKIIDFLSEGLNEELLRWALFLEIPERDEILSRFLRLDPCGKYLNFNYTPTLEEIYDVPQNNVLHIHGEAIDSRSILIIGHGRVLTEIKSLNDVSDIEMLDVREVEGNSSIDSHYKKTFKPTSEIIQAELSFFEGLKNIEEIFVLGHSLSQVDWPYFQRIIECVEGQSVVWWVSCFDMEKQENVKDIKDTMVKLGVDLSRGACK